MKKRNHQGIYLKAGLLSLGLVLELRRWRWWWSQRYAARIEGTVNFEGAYGVLVVDTDEGAGLRLMERHNKTAALVGALYLTSIIAMVWSLAMLQQSTANHFSFLKVITQVQDGDEGEGDSGMQKIKEDGTIENAMTYSNEDWQPDIPEIQTIAVSPTGEVYLHFRHPFAYRDAPNNETPWDMSNGYQCQIFRVSGGVLNDLLTAEPDAANLECIDNQHFIDNWRTGSNEVFHLMQLVLSTIQDRFQTAARWSFIKFLVMKPHLRKLSMLRFVFKTFWLPTSVASLHG